ncbi:MAG TPA: DNA-processing protein DprA [Microbacterium sp.]|uniref:DNA-processing protein DprA n=1 Tax=Microbacterium sp. TaxID=51671 RepID=UPI002B477014|nr:DNA-processing protein DprA [Microbacterium sp.]HKT58273.1 DNA-processing protein DprA [Microbacterium sp.]
MTSSQQERAALFTLLRERRREVSWGRIASDVSAEGSALVVLEERTDGELFPAPVSEVDLANAADQLTDWRAAGYQLVTVLDDTYPARLLDIRETPPFLFYRGKLQRHDPGMSIVGSRSASPWALEMAATVAELLVAQNLTVISGLAAGIDAAAHRAALAAGGRTVAFLGTGIARSYPAANAALQEEIGSRGLLLSQFYPDAPPTKQSFPMRNASMSGYGLATIVIEAGEHSGTRIQARLAGEHGRPVILTSRVAESTSWGRALAGAPNVWVVNTLNELRAAIEEVRSAPERLEDALHALLAS